MSEREPIDAFWGLLGPQGDTTAREVTIVIYDYFVEYGQVVEVVCEAFNNDEEDLGPTLTESEKWWLEERCKDFLQVRVDRERKQAEDDYYDDLRYA